VRSYVVVDASLAVKWVLSEPYAEQALAIAKDWAARDIRPTAPWLLLVEVSDVLHRRTLLGQISPLQAHELATAFLGLGIEIRESPQLHIRALELALELQQPAIYDTHYLALAEILDCDLFTADERFFNSVKERQPRVKLLGEFEVGN
jgi:predicted nucleic acid-binding protein